MENQNYMLKLRNVTFVFIIFSIMGWLYESALFFTRHEPFYNRGYLFGPYLPIYGVGGIILLYLFYGPLKSFINTRNKIQQVLIISALVLFVSTTVEYCVGLPLYIRGIRLWDYSERIYNLQGIICVGASIRFMVLGTILYYTAFPLMEYLTKCKKFIKIFDLLMLLLISIDLIWTITK